MQGVPSWDPPHARTPLLRTLGILSRALVGRGWGLVGVEQGMGGSRAGHWGAGVQDAGTWMTLRLTKCGNVNDDHVHVIADDLVTGETIAIKRCDQLFRHPEDGKRVLREIKLLQFFDHPNLVRIRGLLPPRSPSFLDVYILTEFLDMDLKVPTPSLFLLSPCLL